MNPFQPLSTINLLCTSTARFSLYSKRNLVPKLFKHPKFTREGIRSAVKKTYDYDLTKPHIINPHLYYSKKEDLLQKKLNKSANQPEKKQVTLESIKQDLKDGDLYQRASNRPLNHITILEKEYASEIHDNIDLVQYALKQLSKQIYRYNLRDFSIFTTQVVRSFNNPCLKLIKNHLKKEILRPVCFQSYIFNRKLSEKLQKVFIFTFSNICSHAKRNNLELNELQEKIKQNYFDILESNINLQYKIILITSYMKLKGDDDEVNKQFEDIVKKNLDKFNLNDTFALIQTLVELRQNNLMQQLVDQYCKLYYKNKNLDKNQIKNFSYLSFLVARNSLTINKNQFKKIALEIFINKKDEFQDVRSMLLIGESFYNLDIINQEVYSHIQNNFQNFLRNLTLRKSVQLLKTSSIQTISKNYSEGFISSLLHSINNAIVEQEQSLTHQEKKRMFEFLEYYFQSNKKSLNDYQKIAQILEDQNINL